MHDPKFHRPRPSARSSLLSFIWLVLLAVVVFGRSIHAAQLESEKSLDTRLDTGLDEAGFELGEDASRVDLDFLDPSSRVDAGDDAENREDSRVDERYKETIASRVLEQRQKPAPTALSNNVKINSNVSPGKVVYFSFPQRTINEALSTRSGHDNEDVEDQEIRQELRRRDAEDFIETEKRDEDHDDVKERDENDEEIKERNESEEGKVDVELNEKLKKRQDIPTDGVVYISVNTCLQPDFKPQNVNLNPPQLTLHVSTTSSNQNPGPDTADSLTRRFPLVEGFASVQVSSAAGVYIGISAPNSTVDETVHDWNFDVAASVDGYYHAYNAAGPTLYLIDSDANAALLVTDDLSLATPHNDQSHLDGWVSGGPPLSFFAQNINDTSINGLRRSFCGLATKAMFSATNIPANLVNSPPLNADNVQMGITYKRPGGTAEQQIYIPGLNKSTTYYGFLAMTGNSTSSIPGTVGGGGTVYQAMNFTTKADINCQVIFNLSFCDSINYAVPGNPYKFNMPQLAALYDNATQAHYQNFNYSLQQIPCNTTATAQYSLVKTCDDCAAAYKTWLCAVTMPKCADYTLPSPAPAVDSGDPDDIHIDHFEYLMPRNVGQQPLENSSIPAVTNSTLLNWGATNSSRNADLITNQIQPGPYREILPCEDLCYELVRSCPASFGFGCPLRGKGLEASYGQPGVGIGGVEKCSAPGAVYYQSGAARWSGNSLLMGIVVVVMIMNL